MKIATKNLDKFVKRMILLLITSFTVEVVYLLTIFFYNFNTQVFIQLKALNFFAMLVLPVLFYHFVFKLTRLRTSEDFKLSHYVLPFLLALLYGVLFSMAPEELKTDTSDKLPNWIKGQEVYIIFNYSRFYIRLVVLVIYVYLSVKRLIHYRNEIIQYSSDTIVSSLTWLYQIFGMALLIFPFPILYYFTSNDIYIRFIGLLVPNLSVLMFNVVLCYNIFQQNFVLLTEDIIVDKFSDLEKNGNDYLSHKEVHAYMMTKKPYLDPYLKITDLVPVFATNRTYLSSFINTTYGLNFSMYINKFRLEEFYYLKGLPENKDMDIDELVYLSGFRSFQSLKRSEKILSSLPEFAIKES
ncbi:hypothetical protein [Chryseobacterium rhizosphaerae]|uniref:HTH araC/xylS-type domain-containing protein n=2 Tax=Chryseobacterium rhizosphaerae TaxID=395937 RepID=A0ABX9IIZ8_9FLAO|nr:hypothetical protein [Chryseobacterium rhizosphaerae]REC74686.1 hypothetical protein DRF57_13100 [Chryseobacterium rhizosphaerae]